MTTAVGRHEMKLEPHDGSSILHRLSSAAA